MTGGYTDVPEERLRAHRGAVTDPEDFDLFWADTTGAARLAGWPVRAEPVATGLTTVEVYDVTFAGYAGQPVRAWLRLPHGAPRPLPTVVQYAGYGGCRPPRPAARRIDRRGRAGPRRRGAARLSHAGPAAEGRRRPRRRRPAPGRPS
ncbi:acetylxylan esterase [Micromonospora sp. NPDC047707]|uniref:acetylxylan esterase n=1 Tax=Micromonospora sp. NPDC047707 TaxID=3154498 RepID=UPI003452C136